MLKSLILPLAVLIATVSAQVFPLSDSNFDAVVNGDRNVFVKFFAPWCGPCKRLAPSVKEASRAFSDPNGETIVAELNASSNTKIASRFGVHAFPTMKMFLRGRKDPVDYHGKRTAEDILKFIDEQVRANEARLAQAPANLPRASRQTRRSGKPESPIVLDVSASQMSQVFAAANGRPVVLVFYSHKCPHCRSFLPVYDTISKNNAGVVFVKMDGQANALYRDEFKLKYYPSIVVFYPNGDGGYKWEVYEGSRTESLLINFINQRSRPGLVY